MLGGTRAASAAATLAMAALVLAAKPARAEISQMMCGKSGLTIDTAKPSVIVHFANGFSQIYQTGSETSSYQFLDGTKKPFTSQSEVTVTDREIKFSERYQTADGVNTIRNVFDRKTGIWHSDQNGRVSETKCVR
jgi:hypothetical protein